MNRFAAITIIAVALFATLVLLVVFHADHVAEDAVAAAIGVAIPTIIRFLAGSGDDTKKDSAAEKGAGPLAVLVVAGAALFAHGCADPKPTPQNVENAAAVAQYEVLLADCRKQGKTAKSYDVYEACASAVDRKLCAGNGLRCADDGGAK